jgi:hypothetical protein
LVRFGLQWCERLCTKQGTEAARASRPPHASAAILPSPSRRPSGQFRMHGGSNRPVQGRIERDFVTADHRTSTASASLNFLR